MFNERGGPMPQFDLSDVKAEMAQGMMDQKKGTLPEEKNMPPPIPPDARRASKNENERKVPPPIPADAR